MDWLALQNGSDIRGVALALPGLAEPDAVNLTPAVMASIGSAFVHWLGEKLDLAPNAIRIAVGRDSRLSGPELLVAFAQGACSVGAEVSDFGLASTPALFMSTVTPGYAFNGAAIITASHLPAHRNGVKFFTAQGGLEKTDITALLNAAQNGIGSQTDPPGKFIAQDFMPVYAAQLVQLIRTEVAHPTAHEQPLRGLRIVVDASHGAGGFFATEVLQPLGADITGSVGLEPDGHFPGHVPNPEHPSAIAALRAAVLGHQADFGIVFDPDVDRAAAVDASGQALQRNRLVAIAAAIVLREHPGSTIVTDSITSEGLTEFIEDHLRGRHHRFRRGYRNVINEAQRINREGGESWLAIETSGHAAFRANHFLDDGAYLVALILIELAKAKQQNQDLAALTAALREPVEDQEYRIGINHKPSSEYGNEVLAQLQAWAGEQPDWALVPNNYEGIRVRCQAEDERGWFLLRLSLHDPVMPLNVESDCSGGVHRIVRRLVAFLGRFPDLELSQLNH